MVIKMTLLPIIYTSVLIFSAFMLFVIFLSYAIFKAKARDRVPVYLKHFDQFGNRLAIQSIALNNNVIRQTNIAASILPKKKVTPLNIVKMSKRPDDYTKAVQAMQNERFSNQIIEKAPRQESSSRRTNYKTNSFSNRIEIINRSEKYKTKSMNDEQSIMTVPNRYTNHGDINLLNFYSDISEIDLVSLSTPKAAKAI